MHFAASNSGLSTLQKVNNYCKPHKLFTKILINKFNSYSSELNLTNYSLHNQMKTQANINNNFLQSWKITLVFTIKILTSKLSILNQIMI